MFVRLCVHLTEIEEVSLLPIKVYVLHQQEAVFAILLCVTALGILFSFVARFNELEGRHSHGR
jgi:purine-cytosine permease-like protein